MPETKAANLDLPITAISNRTTLFNQTGSWRSARPRYRRGTSPCEVACPAGENIQLYLDLVRRGELREAWGVIRQDNPLPAVSGRVCYHPCQSGCNRAQFDHSVGIHGVERFVGDRGLSYDETVPLPGERAPRVAIVGSGPAGLSCGYHLVKSGYRATILEALPVAGGMLAVGIPEYRLPRSILNQEIGLLERVGVEIRLNSPLGPERTIDDLFANGYSAVFLATGAHRGRTLELQGSGHDAVMDAVTFLREMNLGRPPRVGAHVAVIGGGNVAIDAARSAMRLGARDAAIFYRRGPVEMPAIREEVDAAARDGVRVVHLAQPVQIDAEKGALKITFQRLTLGEPDSSGRKSAVPLPGSEFAIMADTVILAVGQASTAADLPLGAGRLLDAAGRVEADPTSFQTKRPGLFAGGDAVTGPARVVDAIAAGKGVARAIDAFISGRVLQAPAPQDVVGFDQINTDHFDIVQPASMRELHDQHRRQGFREVVLGYSAESARQEAARCFSCGTCTACDNCWAFCPDMAVKKNGGSYEIDYNYCKGCGICVEECPRGAMAIERETP